MEARIEANSTVEDIEGRHSPGPVFLGLVDFLLFCISFFVLNFMKRGNLVLEQVYVELLFGFVGIWLFTSLSTRKFDNRNFENYGRGLFVLLKSDLYTGYFIALVVVLAGLYSYSRIHIFGTCALLFFL